MIKSEKGKTEISGTVAELSADLESTIRGFRSALKNGEIPEQLIEKLVADAVRCSGMSKEERIKEALDATLEMLKSALVDSL